MIDLAGRTRRFWAAAHYWRRAPHRDRAQAVQILREIAEDAPAKIRDRAINLLREIDNGPEQHPTR